MNENTFPFTSSMKRFNDDDDSQGTERFFVVDGATVVFNSDRVDTTSITPIGPKAVSVRLNLFDGTHIDTQFELTKSGISEKARRQARNAHTGSAASA